MTTGRINQVCASPQGSTGGQAPVCSPAAVNKVWFCHHTHSNRERRLLHAFRTCALTPAVETQWRSNAPPRCLWLQGYAYPQERRMLKSCAPILIQSKYHTKAKVRRNKNLLHRMLSWIPMATMTMLVSTEPNRQSTTTLLRNAAIHFSTRAAHRNAQHQLLRNAAKNSLLNTSCSEMQLSSPFTVQHALLRNAAKFTVQHPNWLFQFLYCKNQHPSPLKMLGNKIRHFKIAFSSKKLLF